MAKLTTKMKRALVAVHHARIVHHASGTCVHICKERAREDISGATLCALQDRGLLRCSNSEMVTFRNSRWSKAQTQVESTWEITEAGDAQAQQVIQEALKMIATYERVANNTTAFFEARLHAGLVAKDASHILTSYYLTVFGQLVREAKERKHV